MSFPLLTAEACSELQRHNREWHRRQALFAHGAPMPWWHRDGIIDQDIRFNYERWLPVQEYQRSLRAVGRLFLPHDSWIPRALTEPQLSLPDLWSNLPERFCNQCTISQEEILPFFCALADPPRFGTDCGRYPEQIREIQQLLGKKDHLKLLDIGCGIGLNTLELASVIHGDIIGVTAEPLETWMAQNRCLPHAPQRQHHFAAYSHITNVRFCSGYAEQLGFSSLDAIVCNGLIGGSFFHQERQFDSLLTFLEQALTPEGILFVACSFHEGRRSAILNFQQMAADRGYTIHGTWRSFFARRHQIEPCDLQSLE